MQQGTRTDILSRDEKLELTKLLEALRMLVKKGRVILHINEERVASVEMQTLL